MTTIYIEIEFRSKLYVITVWDTQGNCLEVTAVYQYATVVALVDYLCRTYGTQDVRRSGCE